MNLSPRKALPLMLALTLTFFGCAGGGYSGTQGNGGGGGGGGGGTVALNKVTIIPIAGPSPQSGTVTATTGNLIVVGYIGTPGQIVGSITDNKGNTYIDSGVHGTSADGGECYYWYAKNATPGVTSFTFNYGVSAADSAEIYDLSGADPNSPLELTATLNNQDQTNGGDLVGPTITPTAAGGIVLVEVGIESNSLTGAMAPFTFDPQDQNNGWAHVANNAVQSYTVTWTENSTVGHWGGAAAVFR